MSQNRNAINSNPFANLSHQTVSGKGQVNNAGGGGGTGVPLDQLSLGTQHNMYGTDKKNAVLVSGRTKADIPLILKITNTGNAAHENFPIFPGFLAFPSSQDLDFLKSEGGAIEFKIEKFKEGSPVSVLGATPNDKDFYTFITGLLGNKASTINRVKIRTDNEENLRTALKTYSLEIIGRQEEGKTWELDERYEEHLNPPTVFRHEIDLGANRIFLSGFETALFLEHLAANSFIQFEFYFDYVESGKVLSPR